MGLDNDTRGWVMTCVSGIACVVGASIICIDLIIQKIPSKRHFRIQDSNGFLASSLSLSFGVMLFSSLNSMLPEAQEYLNKGGMSKSAAAWITIGCFLGGVICIQFFSRVLHQFMPSHIVDCDHIHDAEHDETADKSEPDEVPLKQNGIAEEDTPLLSSSEPRLERLFDHRLNAAQQENRRLPDAPRVVEPAARRPGVQPRLTSRVTTFITGAKASCDEGGPCYGYSDPCGQECLKTASRTPSRTFGRFSNRSLSRQPSLLGTTTTTQQRPRLLHTQTMDEESACISQRSKSNPRAFSGRSQTSTDGIFRARQCSKQPLQSQLEIGQTNTLASNNSQERIESVHSMSESSIANEISHHHHVPSNAFLAIGLQTSIAIALHKAPEGFITYATNHANPNLGFNVFMALFIHNITEGFAMALPLYLAINQRLQAMLWSALFGGASQPLGAGIAALWFKVAGSGEMRPGDTVYGCMFSITAGIMASVALSLFSESLTLTHNRTICTTFAFLGMGILGVSHALTAR